MALIGSLDHVNINTNRLNETVAFFETVLDMENRPEDRPDFDVPGVWMWVGDQAMVHLVQVDDDPGPAQGSLDHVAFRTPNFDVMIDRLIEMGIDHLVEDQPRTGLRQVFFREPNGVRIEVSCPA